MDVVGPAVGSYSQQRIAGKGYALPAFVIDWEQEQAHCPQRRVDAVEWSAEERAVGKVIKIKGFPQGHRVRLFRVVASTRRTDWIVTNDPAADSTEVTQTVCDVRWKIEQVHREGKQVTGLEGCQCRKARIQLKALATATGRTVYQLKHGLLDDYLVQQLKHPSLKMALA